jgi:hypothetical protein
VPLIAGADCDTLIRQSVLSIIAHAGTPYARHS